MSKSNLSVIIPVLNDSVELAAALESCHREGANEVIVVDGGSIDNTVPLAQGSGAKVLIGLPANRAAQMNAGAKTATGDVIVFLHADTRLRPGSLQALRAKVNDRTIIGGGFHRCYETNSQLLKLSSRLGNTRAHYIGWIFGDQAIWVRRAIFEKIGGYPLEPLFEDLDFTRKLRRLGKTALIRPGVTTSARRFNTGIVNRLTKDFALTVRHVCLDPKP